MGGVGGWVSNATDSALTALGFTGMGNAPSADATHSARRWDADGQATFTHTDTSPQGPPPPLAGPGLVVVMEEREREASRG